MMKYNFESEARSLRESLQKSQATTEQMMTLFGALDQRLSALDSSMRPALIRTDAIGEVSRNIDMALMSADAFLADFALLRQAELLIRKGPQEDTRGYLIAMDQLRSLETSRTFRDDARVTSHVNNLLSEAVLKLEEEFKRLLSAHSQPVDPRTLVEDPSAHAMKSTEGVKGKVYKVPFLIPNKPSLMLHDLALALVESGMHQECIQVYRKIHAQALERTLRNLGLEFKEDIKRQPLESPEDRIKTWVYVMGIAVKSLFVGEKQVCHQIFRGIGSLRDLCFAAAIESSVQLLLSFGYTMIKREWPPEMLFSLLEMCKALHELQSEINELLAEEVCRKMRDSAADLIRQLARTGRLAIDGFQKRISEDDASINALDATVHPLTSYVINYFGYLESEYRSTLKLIFEENDAGEQPNHQLAMAMVKILNSLVSNLERISKKYNEPALRYLFVMNNVNHIVNKVRKSKLEDLIDSDWVPRHRKIVQQNANQYRRVAWTPILQTLKIQVANSEGGLGSRSGISRSAAKESFKAFNAQFEELIQRQSQWTVPDLELRENLRLWIAEVLLPAYGNFIKRNGSYVNGSRNQERFLKFTPEDVQQMIDNLFQGGVSLQPKT